MDKGIIYYITECGCEVEKSGINRARIGENTNVTVCRKHGGKVISRKKRCMDCGEYFCLKPLGPGGLRCDDCGKKEIARKRKGQKRYPKKATTATKWSVDKRGDYCRKLPDCMKSGKFVCRGCLDFVGIFAGVDPK